MLGWYSSNYDMSAQDLVKFVHKRLAFLLMLFQNSNSYADMRDSRTDPNLPSSLSSSVTGVNILADFRIQRRDATANHHLPHRQLPRHCSLMAPNSSSPTSQGNCRQSSTAPLPVRNCDAFSGPTLPPPAVKASAFIFLVAGVPRPCCTIVPSLESRRGTRAYPCPRYRAESLVGGLVEFLCVRHRRPLARPPGGAEGLPHCD